MPFITHKTATRRKALERTHAATRKALAERRNFLHRTGILIHQYTGMNVRDRELVRLEHENRDVKRALDALYRQEGRVPETATKALMSATTKRRNRTRRRWRGRSSRSAATAKRKKLVWKLVYAVAGALAMAGAVAGAKNKALQKRLAAWWSQIQESPGQTSVGTQKGEPAVHAPAPAPAVTPISKPEIPSPTRTARKLPPQVRRAQLGIAHRGPNFPFIKTKIRLQFMGRFDLNNNNTIIQEIAKRLKELELRDELVCFSANETNCGEWTTKRSTTGQNQALDSHKYEQMYGILAGDGTPKSVDEAYTIITESFAKLYAYAINHGIHTIWHPGTQQKSLYYGGKWNDLLRDGKNEDLMQKMYNYFKTQDNFTIVDPNSQKFFDMAKHQPKKDPGKKKTSKTPSEDECTRTISRKDFPKAYQNSLMCYTNDIYIRPQNLYAKGKV